MIKQV